MVSPRVNRGAMDIWTNVASWPQAVVAMTCVLAPTGLIALFICLWTKSDNDNEDRGDT